MIGHRDQREDGVHLKDGLHVKRWILISGALGLLASAVSYAILLNTDTVAPYQVRSIAILIWPTGLFLMANEFATSSKEIARNFALAIGGNLVLYVAAGLMLYGLTALVRRLRY